ncbi:hypothetical protein JCM33374_g2972 [Metschnikowia sp. JCM 33374]|nr:hypothetical protein JCM33374_g2972 [Metschnikowia sp. JCM 33374]
MPTRTRSHPASRDSPVQVAKAQVKKVAIIGGGASGAIVLDSLIKEDHVQEIVLFERRDTFGGIWVFDDKRAHNQNNNRDPDQPPLVKVGATRAELDPPLANPFHTNVHLNGLDDVNSTAEPVARLRLLPSAQERFEPTPAYERMKTNIIEKMMTYSDEKQWGDAPGQQYAERAVVQQYISRYIGRHEHNNKLRIATITFRQRLDDGTDLWAQEDFDSLVVATGHYHIPFIPEVPGAKDVQNHYPKVFEHAKFFTNGQKYKDKTVVVVGSRASGADLTKFTSDHAAHVYQSIRTIANTKKIVNSPNVHVKPVIEKFTKTPSGFDVVFADGSSVSNPDHVIYATGYQFSYPFLEREFGDITKNGAIVPQLYQHTFLLSDPLLSVVGVPTDAISFRAFEFQAILVARFLAGKVSLPSVSEQEQWLSNRYKTHGETRSFHTIGAQEARNYMKELARIGTLKPQPSWWEESFSISSKPRWRNMLSPLLSG